ncbi:MAG TPA: FliH/SctL family protein [Candidatus Eremiobacteraceae bacterium]|nr:FliH/SctL family protein [Candidatus Eremiobacteraceae bacterium]
MPTPDGFQPFVPRVVSRRTRTDVSNVEASNNGRCDGELSPVLDLHASEPSAPASQLPFEPRVEPVRTEPLGCDESRCAKFVREHAIRLAGEACARALHKAIARNPLFVARFVDDAIEAAGRATCKRVRLSPADAASCSGRIALDVVADERLVAGEVVVETTGGTVEATIDRRAVLLARAAADS